MNELPDPPVPADADLTDFGFTPIFRSRLFGSRFHARATDAEWRAGFTLWLKSWDQFPAGSLPDDDVDLCRLAELGRDLRQWAKVKRGALHGWYKCSDGLLYHDTVAEGVNDTFKRKQKQSVRGAKGADARWHKQRDAMLEASDKNALSIDVECLGHNASNTQAMLSDGHRSDRTRVEVVPPKPPKRKAQDDDPDFALFWSGYPRKEDKGHARSAWAAAIRKVEPEVIIAGLRRHRFNDDPQYHPLASTWLNGERWGDVKNATPAQLALVSDANPQGRTVLPVSGGF